MTRITRAQQTRLGVFIFLATLILIAFGLRVAGDRLLEQRDDYYINYMDASVNGLQIGGQVQYHGIQIGRVDRIDIDKGNVRNIIVSVSVEGGTPIKDDVTAVLTPVGITGLMQIEITGGSNEAHFLMPGDTLKAGVSTLDNITGKAEVIAEKLELVLNNLAQITGPSQQQAFSRSLANLDTLLTEGRRPLLATLDNTEQLSGDLVQLTDETDRLLARMREVLDSPELAEMLANSAAVTADLAQVDYQELTRNLTSAISEFNRVATHLDLTVVRSRGDLIESLAMLKETLEYLDEFSRRISENPSLLLRTQKRGE